MNTATKQRITFIILVVIAIALLGSIVYIVFDRIEKSKWTYVALEDDSVAEMEEDASLYGMSYLRDPEQVALDFFASEGYGEPTETKLLHSGKTKTYLMTNKEGLKVKMYLIQPGTKGETGIWFVKRYIADPFPDESTDSAGSSSTADSSAAAG